MGFLRRNPEKFILVSAYRNETLRMGKSPVALGLPGKQAMGKYVLRIRHECKTMENSVARMVCVVYVQQKNFNH